MCIPTDVDIYGVIYVRRGDAMVGIPPRAQNVEFELFDIIHSLKLDKLFPVEQFGASRALRGSSISVSSTLPPLNVYEYEDKWERTTYVCDGLKSQMKPQNQRKQINIWGPCGKAELWLSPF